MSLRLAQPQSPVTPTAEDDASSFPGLTRSSTAPSLPSHRPDRSRLAPEDAYVASPPRQVPPFDGDAMAGRSRSRRRRKKEYKKLLWLRQKYRDNYTDQATFLASLQLNPRLQPYQFWSLFADSTVIVQQVCAVIIFLVCFSLILKNRISSTWVAGGGSFAAFLGWVPWTSWEWTHEDGERARREQDGSGGPDSPRGRRLHPYSQTNPPSASSSFTNLAATAWSSPPDKNAHSTSAASLVSTTASAGSVAHDACATSCPDTTQASQRRPSHDPGTRDHSRHTSYDAASDGINGQRPSIHRQSRTERLVGTIKSTVLIVFFVGAVSPILKSLTWSIASDSIWAMSFTLLLVHLFFFDYSIGITPPATISPVGTSSIAGMPRSGPAAWSMNSAIMASAVLASRLRETSRVFSLTIFSIELFALFPIFRRYARAQSLWYDVLLTTVLVVGAGAGAGIAVGSPEDWVGNAFKGLFVSCFTAIIAMGGCSYWLISLQKYKNAIIGPWDPARPVITGTGRIQWTD